MSNTISKLTCFIAADVRDEVNAWIKQNIVNAGPNTFSAPYSETGKEPATHYACCWRIEPDDKAKLDEYLSKNHAKSYTSSFVEESSVKSIVDAWSIRPIASI